MGLQPAVNSEHIARAARYVVLASERLSEAPDPMDQGGRLAQAQQREGHADVVVEVARGSEHGRGIAAMLGEDRGAHFIGGWDADDFFVTLAQKLQSFPPRFVTQPFSHLKVTFSMLTDYSAPRNDSDEAPDFRQSRFDVASVVRAAKAVGNVTYAGALASRVPRGAL